MSQKKINGNTRTMPEEVLQSMEGLALSIVERIAQTRPHQLTDWDELMNHARFGAYQAHQKFNKKNGATFETFACHRMRGAVLDFLRKINETRYFARVLARLDTERQKLEAILGRTVSDEEVCAHSGLLLRSVKRAKIQYELAHPAHLEQEGYGEDGSPLSECIADEHQRTPADILGTKERFEELHRMIQDLPVIHRRVLHLSYWEGKQLREIASDWGLTESRICQLRKAAIGKLRLQRLVNSRLLV
ncbi:MAG: sigma-70 family RNA polymerase sigma factor [bacterium]|nr:sigma-70 family RNA polymerase sigma factor [bacterium]